MTEMRQDVKSLKVLTFPVDVLRRILMHADVRTLLCLSETSQWFRSEVFDNALWKHLALRRFRVTAKTPTSRRLASAGPLCWRTLYANWHMQARMPVSRFSGPAVDAFAKGKGASCFVWMTVVSEDDCRIRESGLRVRVIVQNIFADRLTVLVRGITFQMRHEGLIGTGRPHDAGADCHARVMDCVTDRADPKVNIGINRSAAISSSSLPSSPLRPATSTASAPAASAPFSARFRHRHLHRNAGGHGDDEKGSPQSSTILGRDDFCIISAQIVVKGAVFEIDALERVEYVYVPVIADGKREDVVCKMSDRQIWQCYELLPGGWWARI